MHVVPIHTQEGSCSINYDLSISFSTPLHTFSLLDYTEVEIVSKKCNFYKAVTRQKASAVARQATCSLPKAKG